MPEMALSFEAGPATAKAVSSQGDGLSQHIQLAEAMIRMTV
jgi:hypothetical protein